MLLNLVISGYLRHNNVNSEYPKLTSSKKMLHTLVRIEKLPTY